MTDDANKLKDDIQNMLRGAGRQPQPPVEDGEVEDGDEVYEEQQTQNEIVQPLVDRLKEAVNAALTKEIIQKISNETGVTRQIGQVGVADFHEKLIGHIMSAFEEFDFEE